MSVSRRGVAGSEVYLEVASVCNFACTYCPQSHVRRAQPWLSLEQVAKAVGDLEDTEVVRTVHLWLMGEPLCHPDIEGVWGILASSRLEWDIATNGSLLSAHRMDELIRCRPRRIFLSVQSLTADAFGARQARIDYREYVRRLREAVAAFLAARHDVKLVIKFIAAGGHAGLRRDGTWLMSKASEMVKEIC